MMFINQLEAEFQAVWLIQMLIIHMQKVRHQFFTRDSIYAIALICYRPSVRLSVCLSVTRVDHTKMVEDRIMKFSPYGSPIPLVFREQVSSRNSEGFPQIGGIK